MPSLDYTQKALRYARAVLSGKKTAGRYEKLACQRMLNDLEKQGTKKLPASASTWKTGSVLSW